MAATRAVLAGLVLLGLAGALGYVLVTSSGVSRTTTPTLVSAPSTSATAAAATTVASAAPTTTSVPATTVPSSIVPTTTAAVSNPPVVVALEAALEAWGNFAVTGNMKDLDDSFVVGGPQRRALRQEAPSIREDPPGPPPYSVKASDVFTVSVAPDDVVLRTVVTWQRDGVEDATYTWHVQMRRVDGEWRLYAVEDLTAG